MDITVRQAENGDTPRLFEFIKKAYGPIAELKLPDRWQWEFMHNPYWEESKLPIWIALDGEKIIGQTCALPVRLLTPTGSVHASWSVDTIVLDEYQGKGIGTKIQKANSDHNPIFMSLSMSDANRHVKEKLGSVSLNKVVRYRRLLGVSGGFVRDYLKLRTERRPALKRAARILCTFFRIHTLVALALTPYLSVRSLIFALRHRKMTENITVRAIDRFTPLISSFSEKTGKKLGIMIERSESYLNWKYADQPGMKHSLFLIEDEQNVRGFMVLRDPDPSELSVGIISELFADPDDSSATETLVATAIAHFKGRVNAVDIASSNLPTMKMLSRHFTRIQDVYPMFNSRNPEFGIALAAGLPWYLTLGDHDWDQVHPLPGGAW